MQRGYVGFPFPSKPLAVTEQNVTANVVAGEDINANSLVTISDNGLAYYAKDPSTAIGATRPVFSQEKSYINYNVENNLLNQYGGRAKPYVTGGLISACAPVPSALLSNGNAVVVWQENVAPYNVLFAILNENLVQISNATVLTNITGTATAYSMSVTALTGGGFAIAINMSVAPYIQYAVYNNAGGVVKALATIAGITVSAYTQGSDRIVVKGLSNGNFVIVREAVNAPTVGVYYGVYDASGTVVTAQANISGSGVSSTSGIVSVKAFTAAQGGGFLIMWYQNNTRIAKWNNSGTQTISPITTYGSSSGNYGCTILPDGGFATVTIGSASGGEVKAFNPAGTLLYTTSISSPGGTTFYPLIVTLSSGNFAITHGNAATQTDLSYFPATGTNPVSAYATVAHNTYPLGYPNSNLGSMILPNNEGGVLYIKPTQLAYYFDGACNLITTKLLSGRFGYAASFYADYPQTYISTTSVGVRGTTCYFYGLLTNSETLVTGIMTPSVPKIVPVGVSNNSASAGGVVTITVSGYASLSTPFGAPYSADTQIVGGQKLSIIGNSVNLQGAVSFEPSAPIN